MSTVSISQASRNLSHWINKASYSGEAVVLTSRGRAKAMLIGIDAFQTLLGLPIEEDVALMPTGELRRQFYEALLDAGYETDEQIVGLVRQVRTEIDAEKFGDVE